MVYRIYSAFCGVAWGRSASGGSEQYHIELCKRLAAQGHVVYSYSPLGGVYPAEFAEGVYWRDIEEADASAPGAWIVQRDPGALTFEQQDHPRQVRFFEAHDFDYPGAWWKQYHAVLVESQIHAKYLSALYPDMAATVAVTGAGFPMERAGDVPMWNRNYKRIYHSSNPTRGLLNLLKIFRRAHEFDSELELVIGYGFDYLDVLAKTTPSLNRIREQIAREADQPGVTWLGRLPSVFDVWCEYAKSGMFVYPTSFSEIYCVAVGEAQAFGAIPVISPTMALGENTRHGIVIWGDPSEPLIQARFAREIVGLANRPDVQDKIRPEMVEDARKFFNFQDTVDRIERMCETGIVA